MGTDCRPPENRVKISCLVVDPDNDIPWTPAIVKEIAQPKAPIAPMLNPPPHPVHNHLKPPASKQARRLLLKALTGTNSRVGSKFKIGDQVLELEVRHARTSPERHTVFQQAGCERKVPRGGPWPGKANIATHEISIEVAAPER